VSLSYSKTDSGRWIEDSGFVIRLLPDDDDESRHQRFVVRLKGRQSLLIAHNVELAGRVPLGLGDRVSFRGTYEWNDLGGLVHWTHRDPHGVEDGGYVRRGAKTYR
jgi:hypothetical protein